MTPARADDTPGAVQKDAECRCDCGSLLARLSAVGIELKCRRCKRVVVLPLPALPRHRRGPP